MMSTGNHTAYHTFACTRNAEEALPENVCRDLNIDDLFEKLDYTSSCVGRQYMYHLLCTDKVSDISTYEPLIKRLSEDTPLRNSVVNVLKKLSHTDAYSIVDLLAEEEHQYSSHYLLLLQVCRWLPLFFVGMMLLFSHSAIPFILLLIAYIGNGVLHFRVKNQLAAYFFSIPQLRELLLVTETLSKERTFDEVDGEMKQTVSRLQGLRKKLSAFRFGLRLEGDGAMLVYLFTEFFNIFTLLSTLNVIHSFKAISEYKKEMEQEFRFVGLIDTLCSLSYLRQGLPYWCHPSATSEKGLHAEGVYHPLIKNCVANDLVLTDRSMLITGSNMSGKTSFIRTLAINLLVGKVLNMCFAHRFSIDLNLRLFSVIHTEDDLLEGKSYFFKAAEQVKQALERGDRGNHLLIFDELFKGTNTLERIAINASVFSILAKNNCVLASTHDLELADLLKDTYELYHFSETVSDEDLSFDYKLKQGVAKEGNAIRILKLCDYPREVIDKAMTLVNHAI